MRRWIASISLSVVALAATVFAAPTGAAAAPESPSAQRLQADQLVALGQLRELVGRHPERYAGLSTRGPDRATVHIVGSQFAAAAAELPDLRRLATSAGIEVSVDYEKYSMLELRRIQDSIPVEGPFAGEDAGLSMWGVNPDTNTLDVGVVDVTPELVAKAKDAYGDKVAVSRQPRPKHGVAKPTDMLLASGRRTDTFPYYGGDMIDVVGSSLCSSGFTVTNLYGTRYALTAGHCGPENARVETNNQTYFGTVYFRRLGGGNFDNALVGGVDYDGRIWVGGPFTTTWMPVHSASDSCTGCLVNFDGAFTGEATGRLVADEFCVHFDTGDLSCGLQRAVSANGGQLCQAGDSGGPIFAYDGRGGVIAVGIFTGYWTTTDCIYTRLPPILSYWRSTITTD